MQEVVITKMDKSDTLRRFTYYDIDGINSIYSQLLSNKQDTNSLYAQLFSNKQETTANRKKPGELLGISENLYLLQGFIEQSDIVENPGGCYKVQSFLHVEDKVHAILRHLKINELQKLDEWSDTPCLVAGYATFIEYDYLANKITEVFESGEFKYSDFESFLDDIRFNPEFESMWKQFIDYIREKGVFLNYLFESRPSSKSRMGVKKCIAVDLRYPVILQYSYFNYRLSASDEESIRLLEIPPKTCVLGILRKASTNFFTLKPIIMWYEFSNKVRF